MSTGRTVSAGSRVLIRGAGDVVDRLVLGGAPAYERKGDAFVLPLESKLAVALMGRQVGELVEVRTRSRTVRFSIEAVEG